MLILKLGQHVLFYNILGKQLKYAIPTMNFTLVHCNIQTRYIPGEVQLIMISL